MIAEAIERLADRVLAYEETDLTELINHFKTRMEQSEPGPEWERAVIAYFLINGVRVKNALKLGKLRNHEFKRNGARPALRLVK
jgi:hypothetical protein